MGTCKNIEIMTGMDSSAIANYLSQQNKLDSTAVLARTHNLLSKLSEELTSQGIPYEYVGKKTSLTRSEPFARFHAFLKLLVNPYDNFCFLLIRELIGLSPQEYAGIRLKAAQLGKSHFQVWLSGPGEENLFSLFFQGQPTLGSAVNEIREMLADSIYEAPAQFVTEWLKEHPNDIVEEYLSWLATYDVQDELKEESEGLTLTTIHGAKGLEFPVVIVAGCNEGILPSKQAIASGEIEEERRLMYVAITRARDQLILAVRPEAKEVHGKVYENPVSRFISEACA